MAKEFIQISEDKNTGLIAISPKVIESIASYALEDEKGIHPANSSPFHSAITCKLDDNELDISMDVKVDYGMNVTSVCEAAQKRVAQTIQQMTGLHCRSVVVEVVGFEFVD